MASEHLFTLLFQLITPRATIVDVHALKVLFILFILAVLLARFTAAQEAPIEES